MIITANAYKAECVLEANRNHEIELNSSLEGYANLKIRDMYSGQYVWVTLSKQHRDQLKEAIEMIDGV